MYPPPTVQNALTHSVNFIAQSTINFPDCLSTGEIAKESSLFLSLSTVTLLSQTHGFFPQVARSLFISSSILRSGFSHAALEILRPRRNAALMR